MKETNSEIAIMWVEKGLNEKDSEKKLHYLDMALELDSNNPVALNNKGMLLHKMGKFHEAIECYDRILKQYNMSRYIPALYNKSLTLKKMELFEAALTFMNRALKQQPDNEKIKKHVENLTLIVEGRGEIRPRREAQIPKEKLAVNKVYTQWEPPAVSTLLAYEMKCSHKDIKYYKGFGEDLVKEKIIQDKLNQRIYCCGTCRFHKNDLCQHKDTKSMLISSSAICRNFRPE
ncbi:tetratricopeptide repeat protein [Methanolobus bombayensis]|uniref:tetratricopeptide repeat protein n=1 Tax=Methanolobus bombayensis TaxID=38023 RepID=UPI001AE190C7|nr:tetratricopeptide repeat protein [Methanolobus bombayensis]MBP1908661.1 tetratricopeptide (TPR) repeat protein [Methanolobus bombayensis]